MEAILILLLACSLSFKDVLSHSFNATFESNSSSQSTENLSSLMNPLNSSKSMEELQQHTHHSHEHHFRPGPGFSAESEELCPCYPKGRAPVFQNLDLNQFGIKRLVLYLYYSDLTKQLEVHVPNQAKQKQIPDLYEDGDVLESTQNHNLVNLFNKYVNYTTPRAGNVAKQESSIHQARVTEVKDHQSEIPEIHSLNKTPEKPVTFPIKEPLESHELQSHEKVLPKIEKLNHLPTNPYLGQETSKYPNIKETIYTNPSDHGKIKYITHGHNAISTEHLTTTGDLPEWVKHRYPKTWQYYIAKNPHANVDSTMSSRWNLLNNPHQKAPVLKKQGQIISSSAYKTESQELPEWMRYKHPGQKYHHHPPSKHHAYNLENAYPLKFSGKTKSSPNYYQDLDKLSPTSLWYKRYLDHGIKDVPFDIWLQNQMKKLNNPAKGSTVDIYGVRYVLEKILLENGMKISSDGFIVDKTGRKINMGDLSLRPILIGGPLALKQLIENENNQLHLPNSPYLKAVLLTSSNPMEILGTIPLGTTYLPNGEFTYSGEVDGNEHDYNVPKVPLYQLKDRDYKVGDGLDVLNNKMLPAIDDYAASQQNVVTIKGVKYFAIPKETQISTNTENHNHFNREFMQSAMPQVQVSNLLSHGSFELKPEVTVLRSSNEDIENHESIDTDKNSTEQSNEDHKHVEDVKHNKTEPETTSKESNESHEMLNETHIESKDAENKKDHTNLDWERHSRHADFFDPSTWPQSLEDNLPDDWTDHHNKLLVSHYLPKILPLYRPANVHSDSLKPQHWALQDPLPSDDHIYGSNHHFQLTDDEIPHIPGFRIIPGKPRSHGGHFTAKQLRGDNERPWTKKDLSNYGDINHSLDLYPGFRIIGGHAATSSGAPLSNKGRTGLYGHTGRSLA